VRARRAGFCAAALGSALLAATPSAGAEGAADVSRQRIDAALAEIRPALVQLTVVAERFADGRAVRFPSGGSGVVVTAEGHVLTNFHVAGDGVRIQATLDGGEVMEADVVTHDPLTDLSVLKLRGVPPSGLRPARFADREPVVGEPVLALGSPLSLSSSVTLGIVSNSRRVFTDFAGTRLEDLELEGEPTGLFTLWIQHDALILPGNSGGPLVDLDGRIVGINELGGAGIGFAIPSSIARRVLAGALSGGRLRRADLGFTVLPVLKIGRATGALVSSVDRGSPAEGADLRAGDVLLELAGGEVEVRFFEEVPELYRRISELPIGGPVELVVDRAGRRVRLTARATELEEAEGDEEEFARLGVTLQELTGPLARRLQVEPRSGLLVTGLRAGLPAATARPPVLAGDLISALGGVRLVTLAEARATLAARVAGEVLLELRRDDETILALATLGSDREARRGGELPKAWLGVQTQVVTPELARALDAPDLSGFRITQVLPWSEAERGGLKTGDVLVSIDGERLESRRPQDGENLRRAIEERAIGDEVELALVRGAERLTMRMALEARPRELSELATARAEALGFSVREVSQFDRVRFHWDRGQEGVVVTEVVPGGWAQMAGLEANDLVLAIDDEEITGVATFEAVLARRLAARPPVLAVFLRRGPRTHFAFIEPDWPEPAPTETRP